MITVLKKPQNSLSEIKMFEINRDDLTDSIKQFLQSGGTIIDLLNFGLEEKSLLEQLLTENRVAETSPKLPGLIVQVYLILVRNFELNVFQPIDEFWVEIFWVYLRVITRSWTVKVLSPKYIVRFQ